MTFQAINSTETKSSLPENSIQTEAESIFSENSTFSALYKKKEETDFDKHSKVLNAKYISPNKDRPTIILASVGQISLNLPEVKIKDRPAYLPPIDFITTDAEEKAAPEKHQLTASLDSKTQIQIIEPLEVIKTKKLRKKKVSKYRKYKRSKKYRKKYARYKKSKYKKYSLGKPVKRRKAKRRYKSRYKPTSYLDAFN
ncbi:MAG: hypothetical protein DHS20C07_10100 [Methyloligella sp.]|nr:MAG: hypothetical protein DHS20C07_10100 [Methyloligella sp.]